MTKVLMLKGDKYWEARPMNGEPSILADVTLHLVEAKKIVEPKLDEELGKKNWEFYF